MSYIIHRTTPLGMTESLKVCYYLEIMKLSRRNKKIASLLIVLLLALYSSFITNPSSPKLDPSLLAIKPSEPLPTPTSHYARLQQARVTRVVDGDTIQVD